MRAITPHQVVVSVFVAVLLLGGCGQSEDSAPLVQSESAPPAPGSAEPADPAEPAVPDAGPSGQEVAVAAATALITADDSIPPLPIEEVYQVATLPAEYPESWLLVQDAAFFHMLDGRLFILDAAAETQPEQFKGLVVQTFIANMTQATSRPEFYTVETFYSRTSRGERTDVVTIYDKATLSPLGEVILPGNKRFQGMPPRHAVTLIADEKLLVVFNFNPAASVTVIDIEAREVVSDIQTPGCVLMYPTSTHGFTGVCSNGGLLTTVVDDDGQLVSQTRHEPFFDTDASPIFERAAIVDGTAYFPGFNGEVWPVDLSGESAEVGEVWSLVRDEEAAADWRPGGTAIIDKDDLGRIYVLMHPDGGDGSHAGGGPEVWVFDVASQQRVLRVELQNWGISVAATRGDNPLLVVTSGDMNLDVYDAVTGDYIRTLSDFGQETPFLVTGAR